MRLIEKYRPNLAFGILAFFLIGIFHNPILEGLHFLSHLDDFSKGNCEMHSFESHNTSHNHLIINSLKSTSQDSNSNLPNQKTKKSNNKFNQFCYQNQFKSQSNQLKTNSPNIPTLKAKIIYQTIPSPPPKR